MKTYTSIDSTALGLSALCIIHCLLLPVVSSSLPLIGVLSENEWIHKGLVILTLPVAFSLIVSTKKYLLQGLAASGAALLCASAFMPQFHDIETQMTVFGALLLGLAHIRNLMGQSHTH